jgi:hypothetical protein
MTKTLDALKYVGKNFWKVLPIGSLINQAKKNSPYDNFLEHKEPEKFSQERKKRSRTINRHAGYAALGSTLIGAYLFVGLNDGGWTPKQWKEESQQQKEAIQYYKDVRNDYNSLFGDAVNFEDSLEIYKENGLPIKLEEPNFWEKAKAVNNLE